MCHCYPLINVVLYLRTSVKLHSSIRECIPKFVENEIHNFQHNVKCSQSILEYAGIVCVTGKAWSFRRNDYKTDSVTKGRKSKCSTIKFW